MGFDVDGIKRSQTQFDEICIYETKSIKLIHIPEYLDLIVFTSTSTVRGLAQSTDVRKGRQTAEEAKRNGFFDIIIADQATENSIFDTVVEVFPPHL